MSRTLSVMLSYNMTGGPDEKAHDPALCRSRRGADPRSQHDAADRRHAGAAHHVHRDDPGHDPQGAAGPSAGARSEEHTSELQSLMRISYAVFCLTKKK